MMELTTLIEVDTLRSHPERDKIVILDCRFDLTDPLAGKRAFPAGHIPGAQYANLNLDLSSAVTAASGRHPLPDAQVFARRAGSWGIGDETTTVLYDESNGSIAARAWWLLRWIGATRVAVLNGGLAAWRNAGAELETGEGRPREPKRFTARVQTNFFLTTNEVIGALADPSRLLVDARAQARFAGETEPIDPVAGHVPGAENFPFTQNLGADGRFLPPEELRKRWSGLLRGRKAVALINMCGSGVTACHNLLALEIAGFSGAQLYPGSWSEWIRDPARPVAAN